MTQPLKLIYPTPGLDIRIIPSPNRAHARRLIASVGLRAVLEIRVGPPGAVHAYVPRRGDVRAPVGLRHDGDDGDARGCADGLRLELREEGVAVGLRERRDHLHELRGPGEAVLAARRGLEGVEVDGLALAGEVHHGAHDLADGPHAGLLLGEAVRLEAAAARARLPPGLRHCHRRRRHGKMGREKGGGGILAEVFSYNGFDRRFSLESPVFGLPDPGRILNPD